MHVIHSLFKVEQRQNDEINNRMKRMLEDNRKNQNENDKMKMGLELKNKEYEDLSEILGQTKVELFNSMSNELKSDRMLAIEQRKVLKLENETKDLLNLEF